MKRIYIISGIGVTLLVAGALAYYFTSKQHTQNTGNSSQAPTSSETVSIKDEDTSTIRLLATGDMIAHDSINLNAKQPDGSYDYLQLMADMQPYFEKGDINFCNQATPAGGEEFGVSGYPIFNAPIAFARGIEAVGCNVINIGTNHTNDKGQPLIDATVAAWDDRENVLAVAGANRSKTEQAQVRLFDVKGVTFAFVAYTDYTNEPLPNDFGVNRYSAVLARSQIAKARESADFVIVSMRWGTEYSSAINSRQEQVAQELANAGADVIFGHGPHVLQPVKKITSTDNREVYIWYSLGNFLNSQLEVESLVGGFASMEIDPATLKVTDIGFMPVYQHYEWSQAEKNAEDLLARKNFKMVPLDGSQELIGASQLDTTVEVQTKRVRDVLNTYIEVPLIASSEF